ncbi:unnamed protein product [Symbiodinium pilosum]|uniref:Uncharacterized protein n=1 Tax=Symbiodinium pilosum TaxID=2952 RepID=A0A812VKV9_SYMPI|nr:unnamed protein product [Symbiodinium pilosum]
MKKVALLLVDRKVPVYMVQTRGPGSEFSIPTMEGLSGAIGLIAFCTDDYGARTGIGYETYVELKHAHENGLRIIPVQLCDTFPPQPSKDIDGRGCQQNCVVLRQSIMRVQDIGMQNAEEVARQIETAWMAMRTD